MAEYPDQVLQLLIRMEQLAMSGDKDLAKQLNRLRLNLLGSLGAAGRIDSKAKMQRIRAEMQRLTRERFKQIEETIGEYSETAAEAAIRVEESGMASLGVDASEAYSKMVGPKIVDAAMDRNLPGLPEGRQISVGDMIDRLSGGATQAVGNVANKALIEGLSIDQAARELKKVTDLTGLQAKAAMRTSMLASLNEARDQMASQLDISKEMWLATLDSKTCPYCSGRDGVCDDKGNLPRPPAHPNCRCTLLYLAPGISCEQMKEDMERPQRGPDGKSTRHTPYKDYGEWLKTQPEDFQIEILGKERFQLLKDGKISFKQMYTNTGSRKTLEQIRQQYNLPKKATAKPLPKPTTATRRFPVAGANDHYAAVYDYQKYDAFERLAAADSGYVMQIVDQSRGAFYRDAKRAKGIDNLNTAVINMEAAGVTGANKGATYMHEFGHRVDDLYGPMMAKKWKDGNPVYRDFADVTTTNKWGSALAADSGVRANDMEIWKALGGTGRYSTRNKWEKFKEYEDDFDRKEFFENGIGVEKARGRLEREKLVNDKLDHLRKLADEELKGDYAAMLRLTKEHVRQRRLGENAERLFNNISDNDLMELDMLKSLLMAQRSGAEHFILDRWIGGAKGHSGPEMDRFLLYMADSIEGTSKSKYGFGHGKKYYNNRYSRGAEVFANMLLAWANPDARAFYKRYMPEQTKLFEEFLEEVKDV